jgi:hypothetical protein
MKNPHKLQRNNSKISGKFKFTRMWWEIYENLEINENLEISENLDISRLVCNLVQRFRRHQRLTSYWLSSAVWSRSSLSYFATQGLLTFRDDLSVPVSRELQPKKDCLTTEDETDMLSRNVCKQLTTKTAWQPKKAKTSEQVTLLSHGSEGLKWINSFPKLAGHWLATAT